MYFSFSISISCIRVSLICTGPVDLLGPSLQVLFEVAFEIFSATFFPTILPVAVSLDHFF